MHQGSFRRWTLLGALGAVALLAPACERDQPLTRTGSGRYEGVVNSQQPVGSFDGSGDARQSREPLPATGGSGAQGAPATSDEAQRPQQQPPPGGGTQPGSQVKSGAQGSQGGIGAPGASSPQEKPTDQGGTRQLEEGDSRSSDSDTREGPNSPPRPEEQ